MSIKTSEKLAQEGLRGNRDRLAVGKRVGSCIRQVAHDLERMRGSGGLLHCRKRRRNLRVRRFSLYKEPRRPILRDEKINFRLRLVPDVEERIVAKSEIVPHVNGLEQMACDEVFESRTFVCDFAPVALIPLRRFSNRVFNVPEPRADGEALVEILKCGYPRLYRLFCDTDLAGEGCCHNLVSGAGKEKFGQDSYSCNVGDLRKVAQIFPEELFAAELAPAMGESNVPLDKRLRESAMRPEGLPVFRLDGVRCMDLGCFKFGADKFRDAKRVHVVEKVSPHQTVAAALVDVEPRAASDDKVHAVFIEIEEPLEERLPPNELVDFVKRDDCFAAGSDAEPGGVGEACRVARDKLPRCEVVPSEIPVRECFCERRLSALARTGEKCHLPVVAQMLIKHRLVDSLSLECVFHGGKYIKITFCSQYQTDRWVRMVNTKLTDGSVWCDLFNNTARDCALFLLPQSRQGQKDASCETAPVQYVHKVGAARGDGEMYKSSESLETYDWKKGFMAYLRIKGRADGKGHLEEKTIETYANDVEKIAQRLENCVDNLASTADQFNRTYAEIDGRADLTDKEKSNLKSALGRFASYKQEKCMQMDVATAQAIMGQVNALEKMSREHEETAWRTVFGCMTAYALAIPPLVFSNLTSGWSVSCVIVSAALSFAGIAAFVPVLLKAGRQLYDIKSWGEKLLRHEVKEHFYLPSTWTKTEKCGGMCACILMFASVILLGAAKLIDVSAK